MQELTWWRRRRPTALARPDHERLHQRLVALTPTDASPALPGLVRETVANNGDAAFKVALLLMRDRPTSQLGVDLLASWLLLCLHGPGAFQERARDANRLLMDLHARTATRLRASAVPGSGDRVAAGRHLVIAATDVERTRGWVSVYTPDVREAEERQGGRETHDSQDAAGDETADHASDQPRMRVVRAEQLPSANRMEERALIRAYEPILGELPLVGDAAAPTYLANQIAREFPWLEPLAEHLADELALRQYAGASWFRLAPLLLTGPPGSGKTLAAKRVAELAGVGYDLLSLGGASDARHVAGTARGWSSAQPCGPLVAVKRHRCANPLLILDELEKAGGSDQGGRVQDAVLGMLEPTSAGNFFDEALTVTVDLTAVSWIATANDAAQIGAALKSRLTVVEVPGPDGRHLDALLAQLARGVAAELGVRQDALPQLGDASLAALRADLDAHQDVRRLARAYRRAIAAAVRGCARPVDA